MRERKSAMRAGGDGVHPSQSVQGTLQGTYRAGVAAKYCSYAADDADACALEFELVRRMGRGECEQSN